MSSSRVGLRDVFAMLAHEEFVQFEIFPDDGSLTLDTLVDG